MKTGGEYGGRIVINSAELRRGAKRLRDLSGDLKASAVQLQGAPTPVTAPSVAGIPEAVLNLGNALDALVQPLTTSAVELDRRALWADIADELIAGLPLTGAQLREFMEGLRDGTLVKYAEPWQADLAGQYLGNMYRSSYRESPDKLRELVTILRKNGDIYDETHGAFFAGFIGSFGPTNVAHIARVIQEMEMPGAYGTVDGWHDNDEWYRYFSQQVHLDDKDAMDFMTTFGMAVAVATYTGQLTRWAPGAEEKIGYDPDSWSVAQLLAYKGKFGATFLRDVFQNGVIAQIGREAGNTSGMKPWEQEIRIGGDHGITNDQTRLILDALERNPHAVALALSDPIPEQLQISYKLEGNSNPIAILYDHMDWEDDGKEFAGLYQTGIDWCYQNGEPERAYGMTASLIDRTISSDWRHLDPMTDVLAADLKDHHMADLFLSATGAYGEGPQGDFKAGAVDTIDIDGVRGLHLLLDKGELTELVRAMADRPEADAVFLQGARDYQAELIRTHTTEPAIPGKTDLVWASTLGDFDGIVMNAHDLDAAEDFDRDNRAHQIFFRFVESTIGVVVEGPEGAAAHILIGEIDDATKPSFDALVQSADDEKEVLIATTHAAIAAGYYENGVLGPEGAPPRELLVNGHLASFTELKDPHKIRQYLIWVNTNSELDKVAGEAFDRVDQARDNRVYPAVPH